MAQYTIDALTGNYEAELQQIEAEHRAERAEWYAMLRATPADTLIIMLDQADTMRCDHVLEMLAAEITCRLDQHQAKESTTLARLQVEIDADSTAA